MIDVQISGADPIDGNHRIAGVGIRRNLRVELHSPDPPPVGTKSRFRYITGLLGTTGLGSGTTSMDETAATYFVESDDDFDIHIMGLLVVTADASATHNQWGNIGALSNGIDLTVVEAGETTILWNKVKTHGEALAASGMFNYHSGGSNAGAFQLASWTSGSPGQDAQTVYIPFSEFVPGGLRLARGSEDRINLITNDDMTALDDMFARIYGYKHFE